MAKLVKLTFNIELNLLGAVFDLDPETCEGEPTFIFHSEHFSVLNVEIG